MKRTFLFTAVLLLAAVANAQVITSTSFTKNKSKSKTLWYVKAGATFANSKFSDIDLDDEESISSYLGYNIGIAFDAPIGSKGVFWNMGLQLASKGYKYKYEYKEDGESASYKEKMKLNKIELPLSFGYKYAINNNLAVDARLGAFVNFDLFGKEQWSEEYAYNGKKESDSDSEKINLDGEGIDRLGAGMFFGIGVWYQKLNFNITYQGGMRTQYDMFKERNCMLSIGYAF